MKSICINEKYYKKYFEGRVEGGRFAPVTAAVGICNRPIWVEDLQST